MKKPDLIDVLLWLGVIGCLLTAFLSILVKRYIPEVESLKVICESCQ